MNWPLKPRDPNALPKFEGTFPGWWETAVAGRARDAAESNSWNHDRYIEAEIMEDAYKAIKGPNYAKEPGYVKGMQDYGLLSGDAGPANYDPRLMQQFAFQLSDDEIFDIVRERRQTDPGAFYPHPASREELEREKNRRRQIELDDADTVLRYSTHGVARFAGSAAAALTDEWSLPLLFAGGGTGTGWKGLAKFMAAEGALNAAAEVPMAFKRRAVADEMGREVSAGETAGQIALAAGAGAAFAGVLGGVGRAASYVFARRQAEDAAMAAQAANGLPPIGADAPANWAAIRGGIFAGESGGDYDALFSFSNRAGGPFANVKLTEMTVDEAIAFSAPDGAYGQWVKGQIGRVATPMGAYQIVGTTLRNAKAALGLTGSERMTKDLQERLGQWIYRDQGTSAWVGYRGPNADYRPGAGGAYAGPARGTGGRRDFSTRVDEVTAPNGMRAPVRYRVVDASELKAASGDLQPRDRTRAGSNEQIAEIAARLDPARLMPSPEADRGTPIIGPDMVVESGNGRVAALNRAATENPAAYAAYVDAIKEHAEIPDGVTRPVLVAERTNTFTAEERRAWVRGANTSAIARMAPSEQARLEGDYLTARSFDGYQPGRGLNAPENAGFVRGMLALMPQSERAALLTAEGRLNIDGLRRIRQALFARAFGADDLLRMAAETENPAIEGLLRMLEDIAPDWAAFRSMVDAGYLRPEFDITPALMEAVRLIAKARTENLDGQGVLAAIRDRLAQADLFGDRDPLVEALIGAFFKGKRARPAEAVGEILRRYAAEAAVVGRADMADIFDAPVTPAQALARAVEGFDGRTAYAPARAADKPPVEPLGDISGFDPERFTEGAASPAVERVVAALDDELRAALNDGPFGKVFPGHENDPEGAIALLMREKQGEVRRAVVREDLGEIALIYGNDAMGLRHIEAKHPEILPRLPEILRNGALVGKLSDRAYLQIPGEAPASAVIRLTYDGKDHAWLVTAFDDDQGQIARQLRRSNEPTARASSRIPDATGRNDITATGPENQPVGAPELDAAQDGWAMQRNTEIPIGPPDANGNVPTVRAGDLLDDLQADADLISAMTSCALKGVF